jgi:hypothetical protein
VGYLTATEYLLEEPVGDNTITIIDRLEANGKFETFVFLADQDGGEVLFNSKDINAIAQKLIDLEQEMKKTSPLRNNNA